MKSTTPPAGAAAIQSQKELTAQQASSTPMSESKGPRESTQSQVKGWGGIESFATSRLHLAQSLKTGLSRPESWRIRADRRNEERKRMTGSKEQGAKLTWGAILG